MHPYLAAPLTPGQRQLVDSLSIARAEVESALDAVRPAEIVMHTWRGPASRAARAQLEDLRMQIDSLCVRLDEVFGALQRHFEVEEAARAFLDAAVGGGL